MATVTRTEKTTQVPTLQNGDRLTAEEFDRRYEMLPDVRAELIEGVVYVASPVSSWHGSSHIRLSAWIETYRGFTPGLEASADGTVLLDSKNRPQPDLHLRILPSHGGRTQSTDDAKYVVGAPELAVEVAVSTASYDLHDKKRAYRRNEIWEYIVWRVEDGEIDWFVLREGRYARLKPTAGGILKSERFPGLWLDPKAVLEGDTPTMLRVLQDGLASPEHAAFVEILKANAAKTR